MKIGGALDGKSAARLLTAAALLDYMFLGFVLATIAPVLRQHMGLWLSNPGYVMIFYVVLVLIYWLVCEGFLGGHTLGRFALRLTMRDKNGKPVSSMRRSTRAIKKVLTFGLTGANPNASARYDRVAGVVWHSPMAARSMGFWQLVVAGGPDRGMSVEFRKVPGIKSSHSIKIGRDSSWADLALPRSGKTSGRHCVIRIEKSGELYLRDLGSSNGTWLNGRRLEAETWNPIGTQDVFRVANIIVKIVR